jgi:soluble lytic murein transglycosylase-like protein
LIRAQSSLRRLVLGVGLAIALSACQTPFHGGLWRSPAVEDRAQAPAPEAPTRTERISELLVRHAPDLHPVDRARVAAAVESAREDHHVDPLLLLAIIEQESKFDPRASGPHGSIGLMQIKPFVARDIAKRHGIPWAGAKTLYDPAANVEIGASYLSEMFDMYPDPGLAVAAYNLGPYRVQKLLAHKQQPKSKYLNAVLTRLQVFSSEYGPLEPVADSDSAAE